MSENSRKGLDEFQVMVMASFMPLSCWDRDMSVCCDVRYVWIINAVGVAIETLSNSCVCLSKI